MSGHLPPLYLSCVDRSAVYADAPKSIYEKTMACDVAAGDDAAAPSYYTVSVAHERDNLNAGEERHRVSAHECGPGHGDAPHQFGTLHMHVWANEYLAPDAKKVALSRTTLVNSTFSHDWHEVAGFQPDDKGDQESAFALTVMYNIRWTHPGRPWTGSIGQLDYSYNVRDAHELLKEWLEYALLRGEMPRIRKGQRVSNAQSQICDWDVSDDDDGDDGEG